MLCLPLKRNFGWSFAGAYIRSCRRPEISSGGKHARHQVHAREQSQRSDSSSPGCRTRFTDLPGAGRQAHAVLPVAEGLSQLSRQLLSAWHGQGAAPAR